MTSSLNLASTSNSNHLVQLLNLPLSRCLVDYIVGLTIDVVNYSFGRPPLDRGRPTYRNTFHVKFRQLVDMVIYRAEVTVPMLLVTAVYIARSKPFIQIAQPNWAFERVFLGALVVASKYHNDRSLKNNHWGVATGVFSPQDVSRIEREFLDVLNFELRVEEHDLLAHEAPLLSAFNSPVVKSIHTRNSIVPAAEEETCSWSESDSDSDNASSPSEDSCSCSPVTPVTPLSLFPRPPPFSHLKRSTYPPVRIPTPIRASLSC